MSKFNERWAACVARARQAPGPNDAAPFGFAGRVFALAAERPAESVPLAVIWQRLTLRSLAGIGALLVICAVLEWPYLRDHRPLDPGIEDAVGQLVWAL